jgi:hypothetical protein
MATPVVRALWCITVGYLTVFNYTHGKTSSPAMTHDGVWEVMESNDPLVDRLSHPRLVEIRPGRFRIGKAIFGTFAVEPSLPSEGIRVSMSMYGVRWLKKVYILEPLDVNRIALRGTGSRASVYYLLRRRKRDRECFQMGCGT